MGLSAFPFNFDPRQPIVDVKTGTPVRDGVYFLLALFNRSGGAAGVPKVVTGIIAAGIAQADALGLTGDWNYVETVALGTGVAIPALSVGADCLVWNAGANGLNVYPPNIQAASGPVAIDALAVNAPYVLAAGKMQLFRMVKATLIKSMQLQIP